MSKLPAPFIPSLALLLLAGCATAPTSAPPTGAVADTPSKTATPASSPAAPTAIPAPAPAPLSAPHAAPVVEARPATIKGSEESSAMLDSLTAYVAMVDGVPITAGREGWNTALNIKPGVRRLSVSFIRGVFTAKAELQFVARSHAHYQLKFDTDAQLFGKNSYCEFWIVDTTANRPATDRLRVPLSRIEQPSH